MKEVHEIRVKMSLYCRVEAMDGWMEQNREKQGKYRLV